jgi:hypothetical protein
MGPTSFFGKQKGNKRERERQWTQKVLRLVFSFNFEKEISLNLLFKADHKNERFDVNLEKPMNALKLVRA